MASTFEELAYELQTLGDKYKEITGTELPGSLREAVSQRWELAVEGLESELLTIYRKKDQEEDSRRALPLKKAVAMLQDLEDEIIKAMVPSPSEIAGSQGVTAVKGLLSFWPKLLLNMGEKIVELAKQVVLNPSEAAQAVKLFLANILALLLAGFTNGKNLLGVPELAKWLRLAVVERTKTEKRLRDACLPQRSERRYYCRKKSRR